MKRVYVPEGREHIAYESGPCSRCGSVELVRMSDNPHYGWLCVRCTPIWYRCRQEAATAAFTAALVAWCMQLLPDRTLQ